MGTAPKVRPGCEGPRTSTLQEDFSIVLCGEAGQGIQTVEEALTRVLKRSGYSVFATKEYMSRIRGGNNSTEIRVSSHRVRAFVDAIDLLVPLQRGAIEHLGGRVSPTTAIMGESAVLGDVPGLIDVPLGAMAKELGGAVYSNVIAAGVICGVLRADQGILADYLGGRFSRKGDDVVAKNLEAARKGYAIGTGLLEQGRVRVDICPDPAVAGGCDFISSYPMSPSTGVLTFLAQHAREFDVAVEQAEDEISAINMGIGAWYAGARALVGTSGGGFALMVEGVSLAGMLETPIVIHLAQRPGPATGLPTRTEQGDLELALYAGHGPFPRAIFAPGSIEDAFALTARAFEQADKHQVPAFVLTDEYLMDSYYNFGALDVAGIRPEDHFVRTEKGYRRYAITPSGVSPRGIPGHGDGLVMVDSDEHDEEGHITEDLAVRTAMVDKRMRKAEGLLADARPPELVGPEDYDTLIASWGSTYHVVREALDRLGDPELAALHFTQVWPIHRDTARYLARSKRTIALEGNATAQFARLLKLEFGHEVTDRVLKYSGLNFSVEEVARRVREVLDRGVG
jgi:2-oxoglutarate ferredoxin oxidoreductase subunit alpha